MSEQPANEDYRRWSEIYDPVAAQEIIDDVYVDIIDIGKEADRTVRRDTVYRILLSCADRLYEVRRPISAEI